MAAKCVRKSEQIESRVSKHTKHAGEELGRKSRESAMAYPFQHRKGSPVITLSAGSLNIAIPILREVVAG